MSRVYYDYGILAGVSGVHRMHKPCYFYLVLIGLWCNLIFRSNYVRLCLCDGPVCNNLKYLGYLLMLCHAPCYLDIHASFCPYLACFLKILGMLLISHIICTIAFKGKFNHVHNLWGSYSNIFLGNLFISSS